MQRLIVLLAVLVWLCCGCAKKQADETKGMDARETKDQLQSSVEDKIDTEINNTEINNTEINNTEINNTELNSTDTINTKLADPEPIDIVYFDIEEFSDPYKRTDAAGEVSLTVNIGRLEGYFETDAVGEIYVEGYTASEHGWERILISEIMIIDFSDEKYSYAKRQDNHIQKIISFKIPRTPSYGKIMISFFAGTGVTEDGKPDNVSAANYDEVCFVTDEALGTLLVHGSEPRKVFLDSRSMLYDEGKLSKEEYELFSKYPEMILYQMYQEQVIPGEIFKSKINDSKANDVITLDASEDDKGHSGYLLVAASDQSTDSIFVEASQIKEAYYYNVWDQGYYAKKRGLFALNVVCQNQNKTYLVQYQDQTLQLLATLDGWLWDMYQTSDVQIVLSIERPGKDKAKDEDWSINYFLQQDNTITTQIQ